MSSAPSVVSSSPSSSPSATADLLSSLQIDTHPVLKYALNHAQQLVQARRYQAAESHVKAFMADMQKQIKEAAMVKETEKVDSSAREQPLPTLSQLMTSFLPFLRQVGQLRRENEAGEYDFQLMADEVAKYKSSAPGGKSRPPHAEYVHPQLKLAQLADRNRGVIVSTPGLPEGCAAPVSAEPSTDEPQTARIPANSTLIVAKAVGFVTSDAATAGDTTLSEEAHEEKLATALVTLLALKMGQDASLIPELYKLDAGERFEEDRSRRLASSPSPLDVYRPNHTSSSVSPDDSEPDARDLEIDLARLALIVARNAFAPPQQPDPEEIANGPRAGATGLWITTSLLNHSCRPNAHWFCVGDWMVVRSLRELAPGEEITISYTGFDAKLYSARQTRCQGWGFECHCPEWCEPMQAHPSLKEAEELFVREWRILEPKIHHLVDEVHSSAEATVAHRNALTELGKVKSTLESRIDQFKSKVKDACQLSGLACQGKGGRDNLDESAEIALPPTQAVEETNTKSKGKKKSTSSSSSSVPSSSSFILTCPSHTRALLVHLAAPLTALALCYISLVDGTTATPKSYRTALKKHEDLSLESIDLLGRQYGPGDETAIFAWLEMINTWLQFVSAGIEYRSIEEMKALMQDIIVKRHCQQFGVKLNHFVATWQELLERMGLAELLD